MAFLMSGLYEFVLNDTRDGTDIVCELAAAFPVDVTEAYAGAAPYGVPDTAREGYAWKIDLNPAACWEDGEPITADTWLYSLRELLNPTMKNYRASTLYESTFIIANAQRYYEGRGAWEDVGVIKNNDYSITFVLANPITLFYLQYRLSDLMLLREDRYEKGKRQTGDIVKSSYGTSKDMMLSYGPYKIASWQAEKELTLVRNDAWFGYHDERHTGQYMTTDISIQFIDTHATILSLFLQGKLDITALTTDDLARYGNSDYIQFTPQSYTIKLTFNSDFDTLRNEEAPGVNHTMLSYRDFRAAIALSFDRQEFVQTCFAGSTPGYGLINRSYIANPDTGERYRDTPEAVQALLDFYGTETEADITGYDRDAARTLFQRAYDAALSDGNILPTDIVQLDFHTYNADPTQMRRIAFLQDAVNRASAGTSLEGRITIRQITDENYYDNLKQGNCDVAFTLWGGSAYDPYGILWCYATDEAKNEFGFQPTEERLTIVLDGTAVTKTYNEWYTALCVHEYATADSRIRNTILAANERGLLSYYTMVPFAYQRSATLISHRIVEGTPDYINDLVIRGGIRFMAFTMDDAEWDHYCKAHNNQLAY